MSQMSRVDDVEKPNDIKKRIQINSRRLQKLKERKSYEGIGADPSVELEIEDLERKIEELQAKLRDLEKKNSLERSYQTGSEQKSLQAIAKILEAEMPATFGEVSIQFARMLQCCSAARYLDRDIVILLVGDSTFWDRLDETSLLVNFEGRVRIKRDVRSMLTDSLYRVNKEKHIELHKKLRNYYRKLDRRERRWHYLIEIFYHEWCLLPDDEILTEALNQTIELFGEQDQNSFEDTARILEDLADEHKDRRSLADWGRFLRQGTIIWEIYMGLKHGSNADWEEVLRFCEEMKDTQKAWSLLEKEHKAWIHSWMGDAKINLIDYPFVDAIRDFATSLSFEPENIIVQRKLCEIYADYTE